jgi:hypothetical protein
MVIVMLLSALMIVDVARLWRSRGGDSGTSVLLASLGHAVWPPSSEEGSRGVTKPSRKRLKAS